MEDEIKYALFLDDDPNRWGAFKDWVQQYVPFATHVVWVDNYEDCIANLKSREWDMISLDHDLGTDKTGYDVAKWLERQVYEHNKKIPSSIIIHTANTVGRKNIVDTMMSIKKKQEVTIDVQSFDLPC